MFIQTINNYITRALQIMLAVFMALMIAAVVWQVFTRYALQDPSDFTDELSRYLLIWIGILGGAYTFVIKRHLALELLAAKLSSRGQKVMSIIINLIIFTFSVIAFVYGGSCLVSETLLHGQISPGLALFGHHLLIGYVYVVMPLSGYLICYFSVVDIIQTITDLIHKPSAISAEGQL